MKRRHLHSICLLLVLCSVGAFGCAVVRDPMPPNEIVFMGWGKVNVLHSRDADGTETYVFEREINTSEVLVEITGLCGAIASALALIL